MSGDTKRVRSVYPDAYSMVLSSGVRIVATIGFAESTGDGSARDRAWADAAAKLPDAVPHEGPTIEKLNRQLSKIHYPPSSIATFKRPVYFGVRWSKEVKWFFDADHREIPADQIVEVLNGAAPSAIAPLTEAELTLLIDYHDNQDASAEASDMPEASLYHGLRSAQFKTERDEIQKAQKVILDKLFGTTDGSSAK